MLRDLAAYTVEDKGLNYFITATPILPANKVSYVATKALLSAAGGALMSTLSWNMCSTSHPLMSIAFESLSLGLQTACLGAFFLTSLKGTIKKNNWLAYLLPPIVNPQVRATMIKIVALISVAAATANGVERMTSLLGFPVR